MYRRDVSRGLESQGEKYQNHIHSDSINLFIVLLPDVTQGLEQSLIHKRDSFKACYMPGCVPRM